MEKQTMKDIDTQRSNVVDLRTNKNKAKEFIHYHEIEQGDDEFVNGYIKGIKDFAEYLDDTRQS